MRGLMRAGADDLPLSGAGATAARWGELAAVAARDLSLAKIFESHADARAILAELGGAAPREALLAVWAAENPGQPLVFDPGTGRLRGRKEWCSGAAIVDEGLLTARSPAGERLLVRVAMRQPGIAVEPCAWANAGIAAAETTAVRCDGAVATALGGDGAYLERPGFWQGAAGIAAVWYGGAVAVAGELAASPRLATDPHAAAHLGAVHGLLEATRALLLRTAGWIDENPRGDAMVRAMTLRAVAENAATETLQRVGRALGAGPLCTRPDHARRVADLEIFLRQSHAERDLAALGRALGEGERERLWG